MLYSQCKYQRGGCQFDNFVDAFNAESGGRLSVGSIFSMLTNNFMVGGHTLIDGISKEDPWVSGEWHMIPPTNPEVIKITDQNEFHTGLYLSIEAELREFLDGKKRVGVLLSGGMDSRIAAIILSNLASEYPNIEIIGITWGIENCRDVYLAKHICEHYSWEHVKVDLSPEVLNDNIDVVSRIGLEFSPIHLHGAANLTNERQLENIDGLIAATNGDSLGRGEYSGTDVSGLESIMKQFSNRFGLVSDGCNKLLLDQVSQEVARYEDYRMKNVVGIGKKEFEQQVHYLRRLLHPVMESTGIGVEIYQLFGGNHASKIVFSADYKLRNDTFYHYVIDTYGLSLKKLPWQRTGETFHGEKTQKANSERMKNSTKHYHKYGAWIREELSSVIRQDLDDLISYDFAVFDARVLKSLRNGFTKGGVLKADQIDEKVSWLAAFSRFCSANSSLGFDSFDFDEFKPTGIHVSCAGISKLFAYRCAKSVQYYLGKRK